MSAIRPHHPPSRLTGSDHFRFSSSSTVTDDERVVRLSGDLDRCAADQATRACVDGAGTEVTLDLTGLRFLDTAGYRALLAASQVIEARGGSMTIVNATGGPRRLLNIVGADHAPAE